MKNLPAHMRISSVTVTDDDVTSRQAAATSLATIWGKERTISKLVSKAEEVARVLGGDGNPSPALGAEIQDVIQKKSPAFLYEERPLDISVCAGMAMVSILNGEHGNGGWSTPDFYAATLWSALAYQPVLNASRREFLRQEVLDAASNWAMTSAEKARERTKVPDPGEVEVEIDEAKAVTNNFKEAIADTVEALRRNAALDREELDFLWWAQLGRSRLLKRSLGAIAEPTRILAAGIEGARLLRRFPCEVHREIVLRTLDQDPELDLAEVLADVGEDRATLCSAFADNNVISFPTVFPLLHALVTGEAGGESASVKRRVSEWGERALLEAALVSLIARGPVKL